MHTDRKLAISNKTGSDVMHSRDNQCAADDGENSDDDEYLDVEGFSSDDDDETDIRTPTGRWYSTDSDELDSVISTGNTDEGDISAVQSKPPVREFTSQLNDAAWTSKSTERTRRYA
jgi:hypothetical protein